jgi:hypothetical protein
MQGAFYRLMAVKSPLDGGGFRFAAMHFWSKQGADSAGMLF